MVNFFKNIFVVFFSLFLNENLNSYYKDLYILDNSSFVKYNNNTIPKISCHYLINYCPNKVIVIKNSKSNWKCYYTNNTLNDNNFWESDCIIRYKSNMTNSLSVKIIPRIKQEIIILHYILFVWFLKILLKPFKKLLFYNSLNELLFFIVGYILGTDYEYFSFNFFRQNNFISY